MIDPTPDWGVDAYRQAMWAAGYEPEVLKNAWHQLFVRSSSWKQDAKECTDFISGDGGVRWACRMRNVESCRGKRDVTFRVRRGRGADEVTKMRKADLYAFGWVDGRQLVMWLVFNIKRFLDAKLHEGEHVRWNTDGTTGFIAIPWQRLQETPGVLLAGQTFGAVTTRLVSSDEWIADQRERYERGDVSVLYGWKGAE